MKINVRFWPYRVMGLCGTLNKLLSKFRRRNYFLLGMKMELSTRTLAIAKSLFSESDSKIVESLLLECCANKVPGCDDWSQDDLERIWISVLKLSDGNVNKLLDAIKLANTDYRDLFMSAGFGHDSQAHRLWQP